LEKKLQPRITPRETKKRFGEPFSQGQFLQTFETRRGLGAGGGLLP